MKLKSKNALFLVSIPPSSHLLPSMDPNNVYTCHCQQAYAPPNSPCTEHIESGHHHHDGDWNVQSPQTVDGQMTSHSQIDLPQHHYTQQLDHRQMNFNHFQSPPVVAMDCPSSFTSDDANYIDTNTNVTNLYPAEANQSTSAGPSEAVPLQYRMNETVHNIPPPITSRSVMESMDYHDLNHFPLNEVEALCHSDNHSVHTLTALNTVNTVNTLNTQNHQYYPYNHTPRPQSPDHQRHHQTPHRSRVHQRHGYGHCIDSVQSVYDEFALSPSSDPIQTVNTMTSAIDDIPREMTFELPLPELPRWSLPDSNNSLSSASTAGTERGSCSCSSTSSPSTRSPSITHDAVCSSAVAADKMAFPKCTVVSSTPMTPSRPSRPSRFECAVCSESFCDENNLIEHSESVHHKQCGFCGKSFARKSNLKEHVRIHTGETPYQCTYCGRGFKQRHSLKDHVRTHTGERPFECIQCGKKFAVKNNLRVHMRVHTGEKPYRCEKCLRCFTQKGSLNTHLRTVHKEKGLTSKAPTYSPSANDVQNPMHYQYRGQNEYHTNNYGQNQDQGQNQCQDQHHHHHHHYTMDHDPNLVRDHEVPLNPMANYGDDTHDSSHSTMCCHCRCTCTHCSPVTDVPVAVPLHHVPLPINPVHIQSPQCHDLEHGDCEMCHQLSCGNTNTLHTQPSATSLSSLPSLTDLIYDHQSEPHFTSHPVTPSIARHKVHSLPPPPPPTVHSISNHSNHSNSMPRFESNQPRSTLIHEMVTMPLVPLPQELNPVIPVQYELPTTAFTNPLATNFNLDSHPNSNCNSYSNYNFNAQNDDGTSAVTSVYTENRMDNIDTETSTLSIYPQNVEEKSCPSALPMPKPPIQLYQPTESVQSVIQSEFKESVQSNFEDNPSALSMSETPIQLYQPKESTHSNVYRANEAITNRKSIEMKEEAIAKFQVPTAKSQSLAAPGTGSGSGAAIECAVCSEMFVDDASLIAHTTSQHAKQCGFCGKKFARKSNLKEHFRVHTGIKPFVCSRCGRGFTQQHSLKAHIRTHTGERPFKCTRCDRRFTTKNNLKVHLRVHTGEKPYQCQLCRRRFRQKGSLNIHLRTIHKPKDDDLAPTNYAL